MRSAFGFAARRGHVHVLDWLLGRLQPVREQPGDTVTLGTVADGCSLGVLQRVHARLYAAPQQPTIGELSYALAQAAGSPTPDWREKVQWLEALGSPRSSRACATAALARDASARLQWLVARGYALGAGPVYSAALVGNSEALQYVLAQDDVQAAEPSVILESEETFAADPDGRFQPVSRIHDIARTGNVAVFELLQAAGSSIDQEFAEAAAAGGKLPAVAWAAEQLGAGFELTTRLFRAAAGSGSWPLLRWLHERGCSWDASVLSTAVRACSEEQLEWLVERGCPMGADGAAYVAAVRGGGLLILRCLRRLGCPFAPRTFTAAIQAVNGLDGCFTAPLLWLLDAGCPVDWDAAMRAAAATHHAWLGPWLTEQRQQREGGLQRGRLRSAGLPAAP